MIKYLLILLVKYGSFYAMKDDYITAAEIGEHVFCEHSATLTRLGVRKSEKSIAAMAEGTKRHAVWQKTERRSGWLVRAAVVLVVLGLIWWLLEWTGMD